MKKTVLVTGAGGFIGSHLTETLINQGYKVKALVRYNSLNRWGWIDTFSSEVKQELEVITGNIRDNDLIQSIVKNCDIVFHLAALIAIPYSYRSPRSYVDTNVTGTLNVLQAARLHGSKVVHTSTSEVYGTAQYVPIDEKHPLVGQSPYSASKIGADMMAESFARSFDLPVAITRPFNTFGPRQSARAVIPAIISQLFSDKPTLELGALSPTRDMNYVGNTVDAFICMGESEAANGQVLNFGSGREISIGDLAKLIMDIMGIEKEIVCQEERLRPENSEVNRLLCDSTKVQKLLNWYPKTTLEEGLKHTIDWLKDNQHWYKTSIYNV